MSKITIEAIDQVMERVPGATYAEVREALIKSDGDVIDAIILLQENSTEKENKNKKSIIYINILIVLVISIFVYFRITKAIEPIFSTICKEKAHKIATIVTNEEATNVMKKYKYEDMFNIEKDNERKYKNDWCKYWYNK